MAVTTLSNLISAVRAEAGHALTVSQGKNAEDTIAHLIRRTEYELWTAFDWPQLTVRWDIAVEPGMVEYLYPAQLQFDQIREAFFALKNSQRWLPVEYGIPEEALAPYNKSSVSGPTIQIWENIAGDPDKIRIWPTPTQEGFLRLKGMKQLNQMCELTDCCTLDPTLLSLFVSAELLARAKAEDAANKLQKAQRHLQKLLANKISAKNKVSVMGGARGVRTELASHLPSYRFGFIP